MTATSWSCIVVAALCCLLALDGPTPAQDSAPSACEVPFFRGAGQPGGVTLKLTVVNIGQPCQIKMWSDPEGQIPAAALWAVDEPRHGTLAFPAPNVAAYTPAAGYVGPDRFSYGGRGETARGRIAALRVTVLVTVVSASVRQPEDIVRANPAPT
jgi:hypothetical protein